jgi:hypothetical protein
MYVYMCVYIYIHIYIYIYVYTQTCGMRVFLKYDLLYRVIGIVLRYIIV